MAKLYIYIYTKTALKGMLLKKTITQTNYLKRGFTKFINGILSGSYISNIGVIFFLFEKAKYFFGKNLLTDEF